METPAADLRGETARPRWTFDPQVAARDPGPTPTILAVSPLRSKPSARATLRPRRVVEDGAPWHPEAHPEGTLEDSEWMHWFLNCLDRAFEGPGHAVGGTPQSPVS